ncbi:hypothetical protein EC991_008001 [Linnemannia zychae]|nr:hypothetical protein EC991_008001 [Linnemannia zychae]
MRSILLQDTPFNMRISTILPQFFLVVLAVLVSSAHAGNKNGVCDTAAEKSCYRACIHDPGAPRPCTKACDC